MVWSEIVLVCIIVAVGSFCISGILIIFFKTTSDVEKIREMLEAKENP